MGRKRLRLHSNNKHPLYAVLGSMRARCYNPDNERYSAYGGRGVTICDEWLEDQNAFVFWGEANGWGKGRQIDKDILSKKLGIDPPIYSPETCMFVSQLKNCHNTRQNILTEKEIKQLTKDFTAKEDTNTHRRRIEKRYNLTPTQLGCLLARRCGQSLGRGSTRALTKSNKQRIVVLRQLGIPFPKIATKLNLNYNTCRAWHSSYTRGVHKID